MCRLAPASSPKLFEVNTNAGDRRRPNISTAATAKKLALMLMCVKITRHFFGRYRFPASHSAPQSIRTISAGQCRKRLVQTVMLEAPALFHANCPRFQSSGPKAVAAKSQCAPQRSRWTQVVAPGLRTRCLPRRQRGMK